MSEKTHTVNESADKIRLKERLQQEKPWRDKELVNYLYHEKEMSGPKIADKMGCSISPIYDRIEDTRSISEANKIWTRKLPLKVETTEDGYERFKTKVHGESQSFAHHRLIAVAEYGFEALSGNIVHHENGVPWDNRPENLELMPQSEHAREHLEQIPVNDKLGMLEMSKNSPATHEIIADHNDLSRSTVNTIVARAKSEYYGRRYSTHG